MAVIIIGIGFISIALFVGMVFLAWRSRTESYSRQIHSLAGVLLNLQKNVQSHFGILRQRGELLNGSKHQLNFYPAIHVNYMPPFCAGMNYSVRNSASNELSHGYTNVNGNRNISRKQKHNSVDVLFEQTLALKESNVSVIIISILSLDVILNYIII